MTPEMFIRGQIAAYAHAEGSLAGGFQGMLAIACIVRNRQMAGWYSGNWMHILNTAHDVSAHEERHRPSIDLTCPMFRRVLQEVDDIYTGTFDDDLTSGAFYFLETNDTRPIRPWFQQKIIRDHANHPRIAQVGTLILFA